MFDFSNNKLKYLKEEIELDLPVLECGMALVSYPTNML